MNQLSPSTPARSVEAVSTSLESFLDGQRLGVVQLTVVGLCLLAMLIDGYDMFMFGIALPVIAKAFGVPPSTMTGIIVAQGIGLVLGTIGAGPLADRFGRKPIFVGCVVVFGALTLATAYVHTVAQMAVMRFVAAVFFSGVVPNAIALAGEMAPIRYRSGLIAFVFCGFPGGTALGGVVNGSLLASHSWPIIFIIGGAMPLALAIPFMLFLAESLRFRARRNPRDPRIARMLARMDPALRLTGNESFVLAEDAKGDAREFPIGALLTRKRRPLTLLLWVCFLLSLGVITTVAAWSSTVWNLGVGLPIAQVGLLVGVFSIAGLFGTGTSGFIMDRVGAGPTLFVSFVASGLLMLSLAVANYRSAVIYLLLIGLGYSINTAQGALNAFSANAYPTRMRATGVGWAFGSGRAGGIVGPLAGGAIIATSVGADTFFVVMSLPLLLLALLVPAMIKAHRRANEDPLRP